MTFSVDAIDAHAEGQHGRVVVGGVGRLAAPGATMFEKMKHFEEHGDWFRLLMLREPRGYPRSCVNVLLPPTDPSADAGFVIMEQSSLFATMSGTNLMVVTTVLLETGMLTQTEPVTNLLLEVPAGLIEVRAHCQGRRVRLVEFENVPSFATAVDVPIEVPGFGTVPVSVAWGGMACAVVDADALGVELVPDQARSVGEAIVAVCGAAGEQIGFQHPLNPELTEVEATVVMGLPRDPGNHARQTCGIPTGQMDTSPSGRAPPQAWLSCMHGTPLRSVPSSGPRACWAASFGAGSPARRRSASRRRSCRESGAAPGLRAMPGTCCRTMIPFRRASSWATFGPPRIPARQPSSLPRASEPRLAHAVLISGTAAPVPVVAERLERPGRLMLGDDERGSPRCISTGAMRTANRQ